jgi:hypothetical protein
MNEQAHTTIRRLREENQQLSAELQQARTDAALIIHALDCAMVWIGALIRFLPEGQPLDPGLESAKAGFDRAWNAVHGGRKP